MIRPTRERYLLVCEDSFFSSLSTIISQNDFEGLQCTKTKISCRKFTLTRIYRSWLSTPHFPALFIHTHPGMHTSGNWSFAQRALWTIEGILSNFAPKSPQQHKKMIISSTNYSWNISYVWVTRSETIKKSSSAHIKRRPNASVKSLTKEEKRDPSS